MEKTRIQKVLSECGVASRRKAEELIKNNLVLVNGKTAKLGDKVDPNADKIFVNGKLINRDVKKYYIMLHKPRGFVSTLSDELNRKCVADLVSEIPAKIYPVGRLDKDSEGLLLMTNDGALAHRLLAPKSHVDKVYYVEVDGVLDQEDCDAVESGMTLGDGYTCLPGHLELLTDGRSAYITLHEGKYHQIKRMMAARGKPVVYLKRLRFGPLELDPKLAKGSWRVLTEAEISALFRQ